MASIGDVPDGFELRSPSLRDAPAIADLINEVTRTEIGVPWTTVEETRDELTSPERDRAPEEVLMVEPDGTVAGYLQFWVPSPPVTQIEMLGFVRPRLWGRGLNAWLLRLGEARAGAAASGAPAGRRVALQVARFADNEPAGRLFASLGYGYTRTFWMMRIDLAVPPPPPNVPAGIRIRNLEPGVDEARLHAALAEGFADHWGGPFPAFEQWRHEEIEGEGSVFDPSLWFLAVDGDEIVGAACCRPSSPRSEGTAEVSDLAVRGPWRRRGVGHALLLTAFGAFHRRGIGHAELGVDAENPTGATRLYERAGMHVAFSWEFWEKELRPET